MIDLTTNAVTQVILDLVDETTREGRGRSLRSELGFDASDPGSFSLGADGAALDSLELLTAAGRVNEFFHLYETGVEDLLLRKREVRDWAEIARAALGEGVSGVTFSTSGTTGRPKRVTHSWESLEQEISFLGNVFDGRRRVISTVPAHHIYGFLFTVLLPAHVDVPMLSFTWEDLGELAAHAQAGDLLVSHPALWRYLSRSVGDWPGGVWGTSSTAPLPADIHRDLTAAGLERLWEIYGSTETAGVGLREVPDAPFELFSYFSRQPAGSADAPATGDSGAAEAGDAAAADDPAAALLRRSLPDGRHRTEELRDRLEWVDDRRFYPRGRLDRVVQVGGENVSLEHVEDVLGGMPGVEQAIVRVTEVDGEPRLKAFLVTPAATAAATGPQAPSPEAVDGYARENLRAVERPVSVRIGDDVPRNAMGKIVDWERE
ncbi:MAG: AMP-binding protein [Spirochaetes bacterium]|nr:AMP-binding protein [Spirochaetota bacterium]